MPSGLTGARYFNLTVEVVSDRVSVDGVYPCPCCRSLQSREPGGYDICSICGWEDDPVQEQNPDERSGANRISLNEARLNFQQSGISDPEQARHDAPPKLP